MSDEPRMRAYRLTDRIAEGFQNATQEMEAALMQWAEDIETRLLHLESQAASPMQETGSGELPATTASSTTDERWGAEEFTLLETLKSWLLGLRTMDSLVARLFAYAAREDVLPDDAQILALAAQARRSISPSVGSRPSVVTSESGDVPSRSGGGKAAVEPVCCCPNCDNYCPVHQPQMWAEATSGGS